MMIRTAGGPGLVSPIDFHERKTPRLSRSAWTAIALVAVAHVGVGVALYYQRFEMPTPIETPEGPIIDIFMPTPVEPPKPVEAQPTPVAPNTAVHRPERAPPATVETLAATPNDNATPVTGPVISIVQPVPESVDSGPPATQPQPPQPPAARVIRNPSWISQPSGDQMMRAYPTRAANAGLAGTASLNCMVEANGRVSGCAITGETPAGNGFGRAAQQLSRYFQINPRTVDGSAEGSRVSINLRFVPPAD